ARAIVALPPDVAPAQLQQLDALGVRGVRVMNLPGGAVKMPQLAALERTVRDMDWSLIVQFNGRDIDSHVATLQALEAPYVIDHIGKFMPPVAADDHCVDTILRLLDRGNAWLKLCGCYETSASGGPDYAD